jgi:aromatic ring-opening dioxygenase LigB subunit
LDGEIDHGVVGALLGAGEVKGKVVTCCIPYVGSDTDDVASLTSALLEFGKERDVLFVASAHGSASATPRAPLTERPEGRELDSLIYAALRDGPKALLDIPDELWERAGSCGAPALRVFGGLGLGPAKLLAYDAPVGVGYLVSVHE